MDNVYVASPVVALAVSVFIQVLKNSGWCPWITRETERLNTVVSMVTAMLSALAITVTFDFNQETGHFAAGMSGNLWDVLHVVAHAPVQWAEQHGFYKLFIALPEAMGESRAIQRDILKALVAQAGARLADAKARVDVSGQPIAE